MKLSEVRDILQAEVLSGEDQLDREVVTACGSDLMSDVLAYAKEQALLLTGLVNPQVIRTADMTDMRCVAFVRGKRPDENLLALAKARDVVVMSTPIRMYTACGKLYVKGLGREE